MEHRKLPSKQSEKNLWQAESVLQDLATRIAKYQYPENNSVRLLLDRMRAILGRDEAKLRSHSDELIKAGLVMIKSLMSETETLGKQLEHEIGLVREYGFQGPMTAEPVLAWIKKDAERLAGLDIDCEHRLAQFSSERDSFELRRSQLRSELSAISKELQEMLEEDRKLAAPDRSTEIKTEIESLEQKMAELYRAAAGLCKVPYNAAFDITESIKATEQELVEISVQLQQIDDLLQKLPQQKTNSKTAKRAKNKKLSSLESDVEQVTDAINKKQDLLDELRRIRQELVKLNQLLKTARLDFSGEMARLERQKSRTNLISETKEKLENQKQTLARIEKQLSETKASIAELQKTQQTQRNQQQFYVRQHSAISVLQTKMANCRSRLDSEQEKLESVTPSTAIWIKSICFRIVEIRKSITLTPLRLFLPYQCYIRLITGLLVRKDLILAERTLMELGFLDQDYVEQVDIFNRKNKQGKQLCIDILSF